MAGDADWLHFCCERISKAECFLSGGLLSAFLPMRCPLLRSPGTVFVPNGAFLGAAYSRGWLGFELSSIIGRVDF